MPHFVKHLLTKVISLYLIYFPNQSARITRKNIQLAYPLMPKHQQHQLSNDSIEDLSQKFFDLLTTWVKPVADSRDRVTVVHGFSEFQQTTDGQPTLILLPHLGNWELFGLWLTQYRPYTAMFRPLRVPEISALVRHARERGGNHLVPATTAGVKAMLKRLKHNECAIVLPDQAPKEGEGAYAPFFGLDVLTPVLPYRLALATNARVFIGAALKTQEGYEVVLKKLNDPIADDQDHWLVMMNREIEALVRQYPEQYQWEYRRFRNAPDGSLRYP
ncbi:MAG: hypothetical protein L7S50_02230 [Litoricolaceae bacterium]|nr:hypothetical protein [Litorivicinaceae bacterium]